MTAPNADMPLELTVWFDAECGLCKRVARWLERQPKFVPVHCVAAQSAAEHGCPFTAEALLDKITVTATDGAIYRGGNAWLTVLWALRKYRPWSMRLARGTWRPWAEDLFASITGLAKATKRAGSRRAAKASRTRAKPRT